MERTSSKQRIIKASFRIALIYAVVGSLWILVSDNLIALFRTDLTALTRVQTYKGWLFIIVTAGLLYLLIKREEEALRRSEERFRSLIETTSDWVWEVDENALYTYVSPKIKVLLGYEPEEMLGKAPLDFMPPDEAKRVADIFGPIAAAKKPFTNLENTNLHKDGHPVVLETSGVPFFDSSGKFCGYRGIDRDITERRKLEEQLRHMQKMDAIGQFAGGIAHDFNNILTAIVGYGHITLMKMAADDSRPV